MSKKFKVVCMIGSMKFYDTMLQEETRLTDMGYIVLHPVKSEYIAIPEHIKKQYDDEIRVKIDMSDIIYVIKVQSPRLNTQKIIIRKLLNISISLTN